jgi:hypothetical protein
MTPVQMATMIKVYLDRIVRHAQRSEYEVRTVNGILMPEGRAYQDLQSNLKQLFEACDLLRFNLQDASSDLAPPTREEKIAAVMSSMQFRERMMAYGVVSLVGTLPMECSVQFRHDISVLGQKDRMKHELADRVVDSLSPDRLESMVKWHRERLATAAMQADIQSKDQLQ